MHTISPAGKFDEMLKQLPKPAQRALQSAGYTTVEQIIKVSDQALLQLHGMGPKALRILRAII